jgi:hypothetical protein
LAWPRVMFHLTSKFNTAVFMPAGIELLKSLCLKRLRLHFRQSQRRAKRGLW